LRYMIYAPRRQGSRLVNRKFKIVNSVRASHRRLQGEDGGLPTHRYGKGQFQAILHKSLKIRVLRYFLRASRYFPHASRYPLRAVRYGLRPSRYVLRGFRYSHGLRAIRRDDSAMLHGLRAIFRERPAWDRRGRPITQPRPGGTPP
jgi:hypothetical protein